jgi:hypothetical protein
MSQPTLADLVQVAHRLAWQEQTSVGGFAVAVQHVAQEWEPLEGEPGAWRVTEWVRSPDGVSGVRRESWKTVLGPEGLVKVGAWSKDGAFLAWDPPIVLLPPDPAVGRTWTSSHLRSDGQRLERTAEIAASDRGSGAIAVTPEHQGPQGRTLLRDHWAVGLGWVGFEALLVREQGVLRIWSAGLVRDGLPVAGPAAPGEAEEQGS